MADVYLNGKSLGEHRGGFGAFCFEITTNLSTGGTNLLAVRVSNQWEPDIAPLSGDFSVYGGLYRPVHLIETAEEDFTLTDHGSPGVAWLQTKVTQQEAVIDVTAQISNGTRRNQSQTLVATVLDAKGNPVASREEKITLAPNVTAPYSLRVTVPQPHLWNGRLDPYLYKAVVELRTTDGVVDSVEQPLGLRFYSVDPDKGFFLNGKPYHLHGVDKHQDRYNEGWAVSEADLDEDISLIKEMGCTVVRCAHYQHSDYFYSLCDQAGILVWAEIPQVNEIRDTPEFEETSRNQLLDLIRQNVNHPSIFVWSLFNEIRRRHAGSAPRIAGLEHCRPRRRPDASDHCRDLHQRFAANEQNPRPARLEYLSGLVFGLGNKDDFGASLDKRRQDSRQGGICISEYGAGANAAQHEQNPKQPNAGGQWHPEEWQAEVHEAAWAAMKERPFVWGTFVWCMFDFAVSSRHEGGVPGRNDKGLVTYDRKIKKDAFFFYKANWSDEPTLYITSRRFTERTNAVTDVKIYSNAKKVELLVNGNSLGEMRNATNCVFIWKNAQLKPADNKIEARAELNGKSLTDSCVWTLKSMP